MPQAAARTENTETAPSLVRARGLVPGEIRTRAAANGAPASSSFDPKAMTFEFTLLTNRSCKGWRYILNDGDRWPEYTQVEEKLDMAGVTGLDELVGSSVLDSHRYWDIGSVKGVIEAAAVEGDDLVCRARLSRRDDVADIARDIEDGIIRSVSGGFDPIEEVLTLRDGQVPLVTITKWRPREASLVPVPADPSARIRSGEDPVTARIVPPPAGQRSVETVTTETTATVETVAATTTTEDATALQAAVETARSALASAEAALAKRAAPTQQVRQQVDPAVEAQRAADIEGLRFVAGRRGADAVREFEILVRTGAGIAELRASVTAATATGGGEISGVSGMRSGTVAASAQVTVLKTRSDYAAMRAAAAQGR